MPVSAKVFALRALAFGLLLVVESACGLPGRVRSMFGGELPIQVTIAPDANENSPIAVDVIVVYDLMVLDELLKMSANAWFLKREQFLADHGPALSSEVREWVPGQPVPDLLITYQPGARRIVLFADYDSEGEHRATVDPQQPFRLRLREKDFVVEEQR